MKFGKLRSSAVFLYDCLIRLINMCKINCKVRKPESSETAKFVLLFWSNFAVREASLFMCQGGGGIFACGRGKLASRFRGGKKKCRRLLGGAKKKNMFFLIINHNSTDIWWAWIVICIVSLYCGYVLVILPFIRGVGAKNDSFHNSSDLTHVKSLRLNCNFQVSLI